MGNLNKFYVMGRVSRPPEQVGEAGPQRVLLAVAPGTGHRSPRGGPEPLVFEALGPQASVALGLRVGQSVLLRGQLRQEGSGLVASVQAIDLLAPPRHRPPRQGGEGGDSSEGAEASEGAEPGEGGEPGPGPEGAEPGASGRRPRRRRRRGRRPDGEGPRGPRPEGQAGEPAAPPPPRPPRITPPAPVTPPAPTPPVTPPPDPTIRRDMPF